MRSHIRHRPGILCGAGTSISFFLPSFGTVRVITLTPILQENQVLAACLVVENSDRTLTPQLRPCFARRLPVSVSPARAAHSLAWLGHGCEGAVMG